MNDSVIQTRGLTRNFGARAAVRDLDLQVPRGSVFAFLGRNGSGKSTTIRMLLGLLPPARGHAALLGCDSRKLTPEIRARVGYLAEDHPLYGWMTVRQIGEFQSSFYPRWNPKTFAGVVDHFALRPSARVRQLSRGERAGLCLALTLAPDPELLILDDPAMGLDPVARRALIESMIYLTRREGRTIFFSTHELNDVERVADWLAVLDHGELRACCTVDSFRSRVRQFRLVFEQTPPKLPDFPGLLRATRSERELRLVCVQASADVPRELAALGARSIEPLSLSLEDGLVSYLGERGERTFFLSETEVRS
jgi:ABC-2 type transport system ATP-binding protein